MFENFFLNLLFFEFSGNFLNLFLNFKVKRRHLVDSCIEKFRNIFSPLLEVYFFGLRPDSHFGMILRLQPIKIHSEKLAREHSSQMMFSFFYKPVFFTLDLRIFTTKTGRIHFQKCRKKWYGTFRSRTSMICFQ